MEFTNEEKSMLFDKIAAMYFNKNFGSTSKIDFETLLFSEYIEHCLRNKLPFDDYSLSKLMQPLKNLIKIQKRVFKQWIMYFC